MPYKQPELSWVHIRDFCEKFSWTDARTGLITEGYNPPSNAKDVERVPFTIKFITQDGLVIQGRCVCIKVDHKKHMRMVKFVSSDEIRWVRDYLVMEINGTRFITRTINV